MAIAFVQEGTAATTANATSISVTLTGAPANGNELVMVGGSNTGALTGVSGGGVGTWTFRIGQGGAEGIELWTGATTGGSSTITIATSAAAAGMRVSVSEWSGLSNTIDVTASATSSGVASTTANAGTFTTTNANDLIVAGFDAGGSNASFSAPVGYTSGAYTGPDSFSVAQQMFYRIVSSVVTNENPQSTLAASNLWDGVAGTLQATTITARTRTLRGAGI